MAAISPFISGVAPLISAATPLAQTAITTSQRGSASDASVAQQQAELDYRRQQDAQQREYDRQMQELKYQQTLAQQQAQWQHDEQVRQQEYQQQLAQQQWQVAQDAAQRQIDMGWLARTQDVAAGQLREQQQADTAALESDARTRLASLTAQADTAERQRRDALRRAMGRTRASLGGQGVSAADGSGEAILLGLVKDTNQEGRDAATLDQLKRQAIQQELDNTRRRNLLAQAQLAEKQRLDFLSRYF